MTHFPLDNFYSIGFRNHIDYTDARMVAELSSTLGTIHPARLLPNSNKTEIIFAEINFRKKKWLICAFYIPHKTNISNHFHYLGKGPDSYIGNYDDNLSGDSESGLNGFYYIYNLKNLVKANLL